MWNGKTISIVFPAYNEEDNIATAVLDFLDTGIVREVIVINNNSKDRTAERASSAGARVVTETTPGYGAALRRGLSEATSDYIILAEPDGTFVGRDIIKLLAYSDDFDMVCGTRTTKELIWAEANMGWFLRFGNIIVAKMLEVLFVGPSLSDCGCTLRLIRRESLKNIITKMTVNRSHFLPEMMILALINDLRVIEIPVNYRGRVGQSKITGNLSGAISTGLRMIMIIISYRFKTILHKK
jgi:glycosyltransferase involved in cell wall biosynthesis